MNLKDKILLKIHLFLKVKYSNLFFDLLRNINLIIKEDEKHKKKKIFNNIFLLEKEKKNIYSCFHKILKSMIQKERFLNYNFSHLEFSYLKNKAKLYYKKLNLLSIEIKKKSDLLIEYYIKLCRMEIKKLYKEQIKIVEPVIKNTLNKKIFSLRNRGLGLEKNGKFKKKIVNKKIEEEEDFGLEIENNNNEKNKIINLFIGTFNLKKFLEKKQIIKLKKEGFVNAFIFKDTVPETNDNNNSKVLKFISPKKKLKKIHIISPIKSYLENKNCQTKNIENKELNIKKNNSIINNDDSENEHNSKLLIKKKLNHKKSKSNFSYNNKKTSLDNISQLSINKKYQKRNKNLSQTSFFVSKTKNTKNSFYDSKNGEKTLPRITSSKIPINKTRNTSSHFYQKNFSTINFLSKNDLYY